MLGAVRKPHLTQHINDYSIRIALIKQAEYKPFVRHRPVLIRPV